MLLSNGCWNLQLRFHASVSLTNLLARAPDMLLHVGGLDMRDIASVGAGIGPGSYTGLRCGMAWIRGLVAAIGRPLEMLGIPSLLAWAVETAETYRLDGPVAATVNAFQGEVYVRTVVFQRGRLLDAGTDITMPAAALSAALPRPVTVIGFGCAILKASPASADAAAVPHGSTITRDEGSLALLDTAEGPSARGLLRVLELIGAQRFYCTPDALAPVYLRPSAAERKKERESAR